MPIYELHEVTNIGDSANIDLNNPKSANFAEYSKNDRGTFVIDKNIDITRSRRIVNLNLTKATQSTFNQVIDINFEEFADNVNDPTKFLDNKLQLLEESRAKLLAENSSDKDLIRRLQAEIDNLRKQLELINGAGTTNKVPDTLKARNVLYADRKGRPATLTRSADPGYPKIENKLLSKNRKSMAIIQDNGNFVVYLGNFDEFGNEIKTASSELIPITSFGANNQAAGTAGLKFQISSGKGNLIIFRLGDSSTGRPAETYWQALAENQANLSYSAKLVLDDDGILTLYDGTTKKWSTETLDPPLNVSVTSIGSGGINAGTSVYTLKDLVKDLLRPWFTSNYVTPPGGDPLTDSILIDGETFNLEDAITDLTSSIEELKRTNRTTINTIEQSVRNNLSPYITRIDTINQIAPSIAAEIKKFIG